MENKSLYVKALCKELVLRKHYLNEEKIKTIYFGGGTPSQLSFEDFEEIFQTLQSCFNLDMLEEVTLEANPDDISPAYLESLKNFPFNRISLGVQSFRDTELQFLKRRHNADVAIHAVNDCKKAGFDNISIDLIYGLPNQTSEGWIYNLQQAIDLNIQHISAYHLIYEQGTRISKLLNEGKIKEVDEEISVKMFSTMIDMLNNAGFIHYEISNFSKPDCFSRHNSSYWNGTPYLGVGTSAHSYDGKSRQWNVSNIKKYSDSVLKDILPSTTEIIDVKTAYNDYVLTRLRTMWGIDVQRLHINFGEEISEYFLQQIRKHLKNGNIEKNDTIVRLTKKGIFLSDGIISDLMLI